MVVLGLIEDKHALRQLGHDFPNRATTPAQRDMTSLDTLRTTYDTFVLQTFWYTFISIFLSTRTNTYIYCPCV